MQFKAHDYQKRAVEFIIEHPACGLFLDMGLGKTVITLTAIEELMYDRFDVRKVLVIAPLRVAEDTWSREASKWEHTKELRISKILGDVKHRKAALEQDADVYVINRENVAWLVQLFKDGRIKWPFDMVVIDELSSFKSNSSQRFKALRKMRPFIDRIVGLTGTPAANSLEDLWAEMYLLDKGERLGATITGYRNDYFRPGWAPAGIVYKWEPRPFAMKAITQKIADITMSMKASDYIQLPDRIDSDVMVHLSAKDLKAYKDFEKTSLLSFDSENVVALDAAAMMNKLLQVSNGFIYNEEHEAIGIHKAKAEALDEIIEAADSPVLVFYSFQADKELLLGRYKNARQLNGEKDIADWNAGKVQILLAHPASVGYGLNLQEGGHIIVWYGLTWSLELYQQANARLHRQGQDKPVLVYHLLTEGTADEQVMKRIKEKDVTQSALIEILKDRKGQYGQIKDI